MRSPIAPPVVDGKQLTDQVFYKQEQPAKPTAPVALTLKGLKNGNYLLNVYRTGYRQNDAYTAYLHMGAPSQLTRAQVAALQSAASGAPSESRTVTITGNQFRQQFQMLENDTILVTLTPR